MRPQPPVTPPAVSSTAPPPPPHTNIRAQGYRAVSDKSWVVGRVSRDGAVVYTLVDPNAPADDEDGGEVPPLLALCELLEAGGMGGRDGDLSEGNM